MIGRTTWRVARILGIELRIDASWLFIAVVVSYFFFLRFGEAFAHLGGVSIAALAVSAAVLFFGSVLVHELAHAVVARRRGIEVDGITLFLFGGATHARVESRGPADELLVSAVGPLTSLGLAGLFWGGSVLLGNLPLEVALVLRFLGWLNLVLAIFNLLPGFPLDGGRILRALVWRATGNLATATRIAGAGGQAVGYLIVAAGALAAVTGRIGSGVWLAVIGWFLAQNARASYEEQRIRTLLERVEAADVMTAPPLMDQPAPMEPEGRLNNPVVEAGTPVTEVLVRLRNGEVQQVLVVDDHRVIGVITAAQLATWLTERGFTGV